MRLLVSGGTQDPNIGHLLEGAKKRRIATSTILFGVDTHPAIHWDIQTNQMLLEGEALNPRAAFIRYDVFNHMADGREQSAFRAHAWYAAIAGWIASRADIAVLNRHGEANVLKPEILRMAIAIGMEVPHTVVSNDVARINRLLDGKPGNWIGKPSCGGEYTRVIEEIAGHIQQRDGAAAAPAIVQERLVSPDIRVFRVGSEFMAFSIESKHIDYRTDETCKLTRVENASKSLLQKLKRLTDRLGLDFAAADYKICRDTGKLKFLEVNTAPMFVAFDRAGKGCITETMFRFFEANVTDTKRMKSW